MEWEEDGGLETDHVSYNLSLDSKRCTRFRSHVYIIVAIVLVCISGLVLPSVGVSCTPGVS